LATGHLELGLGAFGLDIDSFSEFFDSDETVGLATAFGRANVPLFGGTWNFEAEIGGVGFFSDGSTDATLEGIGHLWYRAPSAAIGVFGGGTAFFEEGVGTVGLEAEAYFGNVTLGAQGSYNWGDILDELWGLRGYADWYVNPDLRLGGDVQYWSLDSNDLWVFSGDLEKRFTGTPVSAGAAVSYLTGDGSDAWSAMAKLRIFLDQPGTTLQQHDREVPFDFDLVGLAQSDRRLKADIVRIGMLTDDIPLYRFRYLLGDEFFVGVMAQDLLALRPDAVVMGNDGFLRVDYAALGTRMMRWDEWQAIERANLLPPAGSPVGLGISG
jgi:hypothetical protein